MEFIVKSLLTLYMDTWSIWLNVTKYLHCKTICTSRIPWSPNICIFVVSPFPAEKECTDRADKSILFYKKQDFSVVYYVNILQF